MNRKDEKVIPTLDDVIKTGVSDSTQIGDLSSFDDDSYDAEFEEIYLTRTGQHNRTPTNHAQHNVTSNEADTKIQTRARAALDEDTNTIADQIVAERFPRETASLRQNKTSAPATTATTTTNTRSQTQPVKKPAAAPATRPAPVSQTKIEISQLVDEITEQLMPEIEWKIRTRVRDILEQYFPEKE